MNFSNLLVRGAQLLCVLLLCSAVADAASRPRTPGTNEPKPNPDATIEVKQVDSNPLVSEQTMSKLTDAIERIDLRAKVQAGFFENETFGMGAYWMRKVEPSFRQGDTTLIDEFGVKLHAEYNTLNGETSDDSFIGASVNGLVKFFFARQFGGNKFKDRAKLFFLAPYTPLTHLPLTAEKALQKLKVDDFFAFTANLNLIVSAGQMTTFGSHFFGNISAFYMLSGEFQIHVMRLKDDRIRLKIVGVKGKTPGFSVRVGYDPSDDLQMTRVDFIDDRLRGRLRVSPAEFDISWPRGNVFMIDYIADLKDKEVRDAYDSILKSTFTVRTLAKVNSLDSKVASTEKMVLTDVSQLDAIFQRNKDKAVEERPVDRMFKGSDQLIGGSEIKMRLGQQDIAELKVRQNYAENVVSVVDRNEKQRNFYLPDFNVITGGRFLLSYFSEELQKRSNVLFEVNDDKALLGLGELSFYTEYRDRMFKHKEIAAMQKMIKSQLPSGIYDQIDWLNWNEGKDQLNARVTARLIFRPEALDYANEISGVEIYERLVNYVKANGPFASWPERQSDDATRFSHKTEERYARDLIRITEVLARVFNLAYSPQDRGSEFVQLRTNPLWSEIGASFLVQLLEDKAKKQKGDEGTADLMSKMYFETTWEARDADTVHFIYGSCKNRRLYKAVMYIYSILTNREIDLRLIDDNDMPKVPDKAKGMECEE